MLTSELARRLFAAMCFAVAAAVPVGFYILVFSLSGSRGYQVLTAVVPFLVAGFSGFLFGAGILDEKKSMTALRAVGRGLAVAALSYVLLFFVAFVTLAFYNEDLSRLIELLAIAFLFGLFFNGWLAAATGAAAGGLLYLFRLKTKKAA